jgi:hypothetical protein
MQLLTSKKRKTSRTTEDSKELSSPRQAKSHLFSDFPDLFETVKNSPPLTSKLNHMNLVDVPINIHFNNIIRSVHRSLKQCLVCIPCMGYTVL